MQGQGLSVVVDEVRSLATKTQSSKVDLQEIIENFNHKLSMRTTQCEATDKCSIMPKLLNTAFAEISVNVSNVPEVNSSVATPLKSYCQRPKNRRATQ